MDLGVLLNHSSTGMTMYKTITQLFHYTSFEKSAVDDPQITPPNEHIMNT